MQNKVEKADAVSKKTLVTLNTATDFYKANKQQNTRPSTANLSKKNNKQHSPQKENEYSQYLQNKHESKND